MVIVIFGVSGSGKTTVGRLLADRLEWVFLDADDFHSPTNIDKMQRGDPLTDEDRQPWLTSIRQEIERLLATGKDAVLACSALKARYRQILRVSDEVRFVYLHGNYSLVAAQLRERSGHFMNPSLLQSQFADLEEPQPAEDVIAIELGRSPRELVDQIASAIASGRSNAERAREREKEK